MSHRKSLSYLIALAGLLVCVVVGIRASKDGQGFYAIVSLVGSVASLFALFIAIVQLISIERISEATNKAVERTKDNIIHAISLADVSRAMKLIEGVQSHASSNEHRLTHLRLGDIRQILVQLMAIGELNKIEKCEPLLIEVEKHILNLYKVITEQREEFNPSGLNKTLEHLNTVLIKFQIHLIILSSQPSGEYERL